MNNEYMFIIGFKMINSIRSFKSKKGRRRMIYLIKPIDEYLLFLYKYLFFLMEDQYSLDK